MTCFATDRDVLAQLPTNVGAGDFVVLPARLGNQGVKTLAVGAFKLAVVLHPVLNGA